MLFDRLLDLPAVDYLDGEAGSNDFYARQGHEGVTRVAASLLNERNVSATHPVATPRTASVAPTHAVRTADGITSLTAQRLSLSGKASPVQSSVKPATKSSWKKPVSKKKAVVSKNKSKAKPVTKAKSSKTSKAATKHKASAKKKSVKTTKPVKKSKAKPVKKKQA